MPGKSFETQEAFGLTMSQFDAGSGAAGTTTFNLDNGFNEKFTCTGATRTFANPTYLGATVAAATIPNGTLLIIEVRNTSGGALTLTWGSLLVGASTTGPATATHRTILFIWTGAKFAQLAASADTAN